MANRIPEDVLLAILAIVRDRVSGVSGPDLLKALPVGVPVRTLQYRLKHLVVDHRLIRDGKGRWARYRIPDVATGAMVREDPDAPAIPLSKTGARIRVTVRKAPALRQPVGYRRAFLDDYRPNQSCYLSEQERAHLALVGRSPVADQPIGTYANHVLSRLLIDLSWNSSRLEGNTYSLLDTKRLIELGEEADGRTHLDAQMILNHKEAIEFLISAPADIGFNRHTFLNLHALLSNNLLTDSTASGRLRYIAVAIEGSVFHPLEVPQLIAENFDQMLATAAAIHNPFEQAFFLMVQLPYLQPFDDVNKRVSRLAANISLIQHKLTPLSFTDVPRDTYTEAMLGVYELNDVALLKDVFLWAYERSAARYAAVRQSLGQPDLFRLRYRTELRELVSELVRTCVVRRDAAARIAAWSAQAIDVDDRAHFADIVEAELINLHEGNFARYRLRPSEFSAWQSVWRIRDKE